MNIILEKFWFIIAILATILTMYLIIIDGFNAAIYYILITGLVWGMYLIRRGIRIRMSKIDKDKPKKTQ